MTSSIKTYIGIGIGLVCLALIIYGATLLIERNRKEDPVIAIVNTVSIYRSRLDSQITQLEANPQVSVPSKDKVEERAQFEKIVLENIINEEVFYQEALKQGFSASEEEKQEAYNTLLAQFENEQALRDRIASIGITTERLFDDITRYIVTDKLQAHILEGKDITVTDADIETFYKEQVVAQGLTIELADIKKQIRGQLEQDKVLAILQEFIASKRAEATIEIQL